MIRTEAEQSAYRNIAVASMVSGILTLAALIVTLAWIGMSIAAGSGGFAFMEVLPIMGPVLIVLGSVGVILGAIALSRRPSRRPGTIGLALSLSPLLAYGIFFVIAIATR